MAFIRMGQGSQYVDLREGSQKYFYDNGSKVRGFGSYGEFIYALSTHARRSGMKAGRLMRLEDFLRNLYGENMEKVEDVGPRAEMAHILAEHLDQRLDRMELTKREEKGLQDWADKSFVECQGCSEEWRVTTPEKVRCRDCHKELLVRGPVYKRFK